MVATNVWCIAFVFYQMLENDRDAHAEFLASSNHCRSFVATLTDRVKSDSSLNHLNDLKCENDHVLFPLIVAKIFKCFAKNFMKRKNAPISKHQGSDRKIRKLQSQK